MIEVVGIKFKDDEKIYYYNPNKFQLEKGEKCIVETAAGKGEAEVSLANFYVEPDKIYAPLRRVMDYITDKKEVFEQKKQRMEAKAKEFCSKRIEARNMMMKLVDVKYTDDLKKVVFYFVAEKRVDFRELLKDLVKSLRVKIELRQISRREYAKKIGGIGICGRICCCKNHLKAFSPITIKMAKIQGMPLNPSKISGACGRLLCCLAYEKYEAPVKTIVQQYIAEPENIEGIVEDTGEALPAAAEADVDWNE
ncbi:MAG TPA: regulatory iron-sulfur-containing complex subunit RicT [Candidatus Goldiibacteriota bacterium]|nr:regulatory iron-sulfur-containing complex subunit RicT [Candidatus Goldiibacteriota bacterium]